MSIKPDAQERAQVSKQVLKDSVPTDDSVALPNAAKGATKSKQQRKNWPWSTT
jgi:hypothetical protein